SFFFPDLGTLAIALSRLPLEAYKSSDDEDDDDQDDDNADGQDDDNEQTESDNDGDDFVHPKLSNFDEEEEGSNLRVETPSHFESIDDEAYDDVTREDNVEEEKLDEEKTNKKEEEGRDTEITDALLPNFQATRVIEDTHVIIIVVTPEAQQQSSSVSSGFISNMLNPNPDTGIDSILNLNTELTSLVMNIEIPPSSVTTFPLPPIPLIQPQQQTPVPTPAIVPTNLSKLELNKILIDKIESNKSIYQSDQQKTFYKALIDAYETSKVILDTYGDTVMFKRRRDDEDDDEEPFAGSNRWSKRRRAGKEPESSSAPKEKTSKSAGKSKEGSKSHQKSTGKSVQEDEPIHTVEDLEEPTPQEFNTGFTEDRPVKEASQLPNWFQKSAKPPTPDRQQYPHDLHKPLPLIPNSQGRRVIPSDHFINNDLAYLKGGASSRTYATLVTKTKAADYRQSLVLITIRSWRLCRFLKPIRKLRGLFNRSIFSKTCIEILRCGFFQVFDNLPVDLEVFSFGALDDSGSFPALLLLDHRFDPAKGYSSSSSSSRRLLNMTVSPYVS
nr:hypothetical protein [Tanacetum cinerariifolium]